MEGAENENSAKIDNGRKHVNSYSIWKLAIVSALLAAGSVITDGDIDAGQQKASTCAGCHGANGEGMGDNPPVAGLDSEALNSSMKAYKSAGRNPTR